MGSKRKPLPGTEFQPLGGAETKGAVHDDEVIEVIVVVRAAEPVVHSHDHGRWLQHPHERPRLEHERRRARHATSDDLDRVCAFAEEHALDVVERSERRRSVVLQGSAHALATAFGVKLIRYGHEKGDHHGHEGPIHLPEELHEIVVAVLGLNDRPIGEKQRADMAAHAAKPYMYPATDLAEIYDFPRDVDGAGQTIGIVELSDRRNPCGYTRSDLETFFAALELPVPAIRDVVLPGSANAPASSEDVATYMQWVASVATDPRQSSKPPSKGKATAEVVMDIELAGASAPGAEIIVYFTPDSESGVFQVLHEILEAGEVSILSFSWAWEERHDALEKLIDELLARAADPTADRHPITFCAASGDYGGSKLCYPAASSWALGCGGTSLPLVGQPATAESVWNTREFGAASGGGVSRYTKQPKWQTGLSVPDSGRGVPGRGVPDVALVADPASHCKIFVGGVWGPAGGTSASAPVWAGLVARVNQALGSAQGYLNPRLYQVAAKRPAAFRQVTKGDNIVSGLGYEAAAGWNPCTGLGCPSGQELVEALEPSPSGS